MIDNKITVDEKRLKIILVIVSAYVFYRLYFRLYGLIGFLLPLEAWSILDIVIIVFFVLAVAPVSIGVSRLLIKFLMKTELEFPQIAI